MNYKELVENPDTKAIFIAEAGINHDGNLETAKKMIDVAVQAKADYVKFQSFEAKKLVTPDALKSSYIESGSRKGESFRDILKRLELSIDDQRILWEYCDRLGIRFLSTAFDTESFDFLVNLGIDVVKVASGELTNIPFLQDMAAVGLPMIVSTGMATLGEIEEAIDAIVNKEGNKQLVLMHCISWYPAEFDTSNLCFMETLRKAFGFPVGFSDHTLGINMSIAARALGAVVLEKHFTLDAKLFGPDHAASIEPDQLIELVKGVRQVEAGLGSSVRQFEEKELGQRKVHRRSLTAKKAIKLGEVFTNDNLTVKRPGIGLKPKHFYSVIGKKAARDINAEDCLKWSDIAS